MRILVRWCLAICLIANTLLLMAIPSHADFNKREWPLYRQIQSTRSGEFGSVSLDRSILLSSPTDAIRIINSSDQEVPYAVIEKTGGYSTDSFNPTIYNRSSIAKKYFQFTLDLGSNTDSNMVEIETLAANFTCRVLIEGSDDNRHWALLRKDAYIFDFSRDKHEYNSQVSYPRCTFRYLRIKIMADNGRIVSASGATVYIKRQDPQQTIFLYNGIGSISKNKSDKSQFITIDLSGKYIPKGMAEIEAEENIYRRTLNIMGSKDGKNWDYLGAGDIHMVKINKFVEKSTVVQFEGGHYRYLRIQIPYENDLPLTFKKIKIFTLKQVLVFPLKYGSDLRLFYGNSAADNPSYDFGALYLDYARKVNPAVFQLGPVQKNPDFFTTKYWLDENPWILWVVFFCATIGLAYLIVKMMRPMKSDQPSK